jgi:hypothetical protein
MPSQRHDSHVFLFRNQPSLAAELIRDALGGTLPPYGEARIVSADLSEVQPAEYRADMVVELWNDGAPVYGIVVEVQLDPKERKPFVWPAYVANLRAKLECPVALLVVTPSPATARWASQRVEMGGLHHFTPYVLGPSAIPEVTDEARALENPELAVLSAMAHGRDRNVERAVEIALAAQKASVGLDDNRSRIYLDLIISSLGKVARQALKNMDPRTYVYQSDFARKYIAQGRAEGRSEGRLEGRSEGRLEGRSEGKVELVSRLLSIRFGALNTRVLARLQRASVTELESIGERLLTASTLDEALGSLMSGRRRRQAGNVTGSKPRKQSE